MSIKIETGLHHIAETKFIEVNGTAFAYRRFGKPDGIPVVLFQHFTGTMDNWDPLVTNGLAEYFPVVLFDNMGIGASAGDTPSNIETMAEDAICFIKALNFDKINMLGFSMGGFIAQQIAMDEPGLVNKIILAGTGPRSGEGISDIVKPLTASASMSEEEQKLYLFYESTPSSRKLGRQSLLRINERTIDRDPNTEMIAVQAQLTSILNWAQPGSGSLEELRKIKHAVLIINGSNDIVVPTINSYVLFRYLPNAKLSLYPDAGHGSIFQYPELFLNEAIPFLKDK